MTFSDNLDVVFEAFGDDFKVSARPFAFVENELPHLAEADIDLVKVGIDFGEPRVDFVKAGIDFGEPRVDFVKAGIDFGESRVDFVKADIDFREAAVDTLEVTLQIVVVHDGTKSSGRAT